MAQHWTLKTHWKRLLQFIKEILFFQNHKKSELNALIIDNLEQHMTPNAISIN
jgi:hypothetical protein